MRLASDPRRGGGARGGAGPVVLPKSRRLTVGGSGVGVYSIQVNATTAVTHTNVTDDTPEEIRDALVAALAAHALVEAEADDVEVDELVVAGLEVGTDFTLTLLSPASVLTQAAEQELRQPAVGLNVHMIIDRPAA